MIMHTVQVFFRAAGVLPSRLKRFERNILWDIN